MTHRFHVYTCSRCWLRTHSLGIPEHWCGFCRAYSDELDGSAPQHWRLDGNRRAIRCSASRVGDELRSGRESIGFDQVALRDGTQAFVRTEFTCVDVGGDETTPMLFETRLVRDIGPVFDEFTRHYATWGEAEAGHTAVLARFRVRG